MAGDTPIGRNNRMSIKQAVYTQCSVNSSRRSASPRRDRGRRHATSWCFARSDRPAELSAVVIGSGFAGLAAAAGLSKRFQRVTLLERDTVLFQVAAEETSEPQQYEAGVMKRQGVSQYKQPHVMLTRGLQLMEELFPNYQAKLHKAGALQTDHLRDTVIFDWGKEWAPGKPSTFQGVAASRHLYETVLRTCVAEVNNLDVQTGAVVTGVEYDANEKRVTGVKLKNHQNIQADLVIEASGSSSRMAEWLQQLGHALPPTMTVDAGLRYTARMYEIPHDPERNWLTAVCGSNPVYDRSAMLVPIETNKWQALFAGYPGSQCPSDEAGLMEWARALPSQTIYNALRNAKPVTPISTFAKTRNFRRLYEQAPPPKGLCVIGDAACCFNPVMGQGMTVAVMGSHLLCESIDKQLARSGSTRQQQLAALDSLPAAFHQALGKMLDYPWAIATGQDAKKPNAVVDLPGQSKQAVPSWLNSYLLVLQTVCLEDQYLLTKLAAVNHMIAPPTVLFMPDVALRVLWRWLGGQARAFQQTTTSNAAAVPGSNT